MSVQTEITRISGNVTAAFQAIVEKGVTVPTGSTSDALASLIAAIETGSGGSGGGVSLEGMKEIKTGSFTPAADFTNGSEITITPGFEATNKNYANACSFILLWHDSNTMDSEYSRRLYCGFATAACDEYAGVYSNSLLVLTDGKYVTSDTSSVVSHTNGIIGSFTLSSGIYLSSKTIHWLAAVI